MDFLCQIIDSQIRSMVGSQNVLDPKAISILPETSKKLATGTNGQ
ncbi:hypothetical protein RINTHM_15900 [Richelia intracellularis HM01]|nr:hypothetical protein RINTHM_15900 [Richelia intracellularis HM01]